MDDLGPGRGAPHHLAEPVELAGHVVLGVGLVELSRMSASPLENLLDELGDGEADGSSSGASSAWRRRSV